VSDAAAARARARPHLVPSRPAGDVASPQAGAIGARRVDGRQCVIQAAQLVAEDSQTDEQIAAKVGITKRQLERWKRQPAFASTTPTANMC
jgi:hypothetical protein